MTLPPALLDDTRRVIELAAKRPVDCGAAQVIEAVVDQQAPGARTFI